MIKDLNLLTDRQLIKNIRKNKCEFSFNELCRRYIKVIDNEINKFLFNNKNLSLSDLKNDNYYIIDKTIQKFNLRKKIKFSTYLIYNCKWHSLLYKRNNSKEIPTDSSQIFHHILNYKKPEEDDNDKQNIKNNIEKVYDIISALGDDRIKNIFKLRFEYNSVNKKNDWNYISKQLNLNINTAKKLYRIGKKMVIENFNKK